MKAWEETHPDIKVRFEHTPYSGYDSKILTRIAGGAAPDVIAAEVNYFVTFATRKVFADLAPFIKSDATFSLDDFFPSIVDRFSVGDAVYAIPRDVAPFACVYYNKDIFFLSIFSLPFLLQWNNWFHYQPQLICFYIHKNRNHVLG